MTLLTFPERVVPVTVERAARVLDFNPKTGGWSKLQDGLTIDLSSAEFAEIASLAQIALLVEGAARHQIPVTVFIPPRRQPFNQKSTTWRDELRANCSRFMEHCGFYKLLQLGHIPTASKFVKVQEKNFDASNPVASGAVDKKSTGAPDFFLRRIFSMSWFQPTSGSELQRSERYAKAILGFADLGLAARDAEGIAGTILNELVENVFVHAPENETPSIIKPFSLLGAMVLDPASYKANPSQFLPFMNPFLEWALSTESPIVRIIAGDSGRGIPTVLRPYFEKLSEPMTVAGMELNPTERVLLWSFNKWSTSDLTTAATKRSTRGLWRVERFVRSYRGLVTVRSADALIGLSYEDSNDRIVLHDPYVSNLPGTFLDIYLLPKAAALPSPHRQPARTPRGVELLRAQGNQTSLLTPDEELAIVTQLRSSHLGARKCVAVTLEKASATDQEIQAALARLTDFPNHGEIAVVFPRLTWKQLESPFDSFNVYHDEASPKSQDSNRHGQEPIRVFDATGRERWLGGDSLVRDILRQVSAAPSNSLVLPIEKNSKSVNSDLHRLLNDQADLIEIVPDRSTASLRMTSTDINNDYASQIAKALKNDIEAADSKNVLKGEYRTPTLEVVRRWMNIPELVRESIGFSQLAYALAWRLSDRVSLPQNTVMVYGDSSHSEFAQSLATCLNIGTPHLLPNALGSLARPDIARITSGARAICCTDVILTENTVTRLATDLLRYSTEVTAIVCIVDARSNPSETVECLGRDIPLISLTKINISLSESSLSPSNIADIDPILRTPLLHADSGRPEPIYDPSSAELAQLCTAQPGILGLGHIESFNLRHFLVYLNPRKLLQSADVKEKISKSFSNHMKEWVESLQSLPPRTPVLEVWYPGPEPFAKQLAELIQIEFLWSDFGYTDVKLRPIPRAECFGTWVFPKDVSYFRQPTDVLVVDWGSLTATTTEQMMRLAARAGSRSVLALIFLSQMAQPEEMFLRQITGLDAVQLSGNSANDSNPSQAALPFEAVGTTVADDQGRHRNIPARVRFLSTLQVTFHAASECPICVTRDRYAEDARDCPIEMLRSHAGRMAATLSVIDRERAFDRQDQDLFGSPLTPHDILEVVRWRTDLYNAIRSTSARTHVRDKILGIGNNTTNIAWKALVRLLVAEPTWLSVPPLSFVALRKGVALLARESLLNPESTDTESSFSKELVSVLRDASKEDFIAALPAIFAASRHDSGLRTHLLYEVFTYLRRPYHASTKELGLLRHNLQQCADSTRTPAPTADDGEFFLTLTALGRSCQLRMEMLDSGKKDIIESWRSLRDTYFDSIDTHADVIEAMRYLKLIVQRPAEISLPSESDWLGALQRWDICCTFLAAQVLPCLASMHGLIASDFFSAKVTLGDHERFQSLAKAQSADDMYRLTQILYQFRTNPGLFKNDERRTQCQTEVDWWYKMFLKVGPEGSQGPSGAIFLQTVRNCPTRLLEVLETAKNSAGHSAGVFKWTVHPQNDDVSVFCDRDLLIHSFVHLIQNACGPKHAIENRPEDFVPRVEIDWKEDDSSIRVSVRNDGTKSSQKPGKGLDRIRRELRAFGATLTAADSAPPWTFNSDITLRKW